jgi:glycosyltransferase involved in cell wall biosynthesis
VSGSVTSREANDADSIDDSLRRAPLSERLRYLLTFGEHAALAASLRSVPRRKPSVDTGEGLRATVLSPFPPCHHGTVSRFSHWAPHLRALGCELEILTPCSDREFAQFGQGDAVADQHFYRACLRSQRRNFRHAAAADVVVLHRGLLPFSPWQRPTFEREFSRVNPRIVYDFFDAIWLARQEASAQSSRIARWLNPADKVEQIMALSAVVTVSNEQLAEWARPRHRDVRIVPMLIEVDDYELRRHAQRSPLILGWVGSHYQLPRLLSLAPALRRLAAERDIVLRVVSSQSVAIEGVPIECRTHPWSPQTDREDFADLDIGLLPLKDSEHDRGKSPFKLLQYAAAGLPIVATPVAIDQEVMRPGMCFLPATTEQEWLETMVRLVDDVDLRARLGAEARATVRRHYSHAAYANEFLQALRAAYRGPVPQGRPVTAARASGA